MSGPVVSSQLQSQASIDSTDTQAPATFTTFLRDVPPQLIILLAELGPYIASIRRVAEAVSWRSEFSDSWLLLGLWWALCLLSEFTVRYFVLAILAVLYVYLSIRTTPRARPPVTEQSLQSTVIDLSVIEALLPSFPQPHPLPLNVVARVLAILYVPSLALTYFARLRVVLAVLGTILLTWRSRWAHHLRDVAWRSAWIRRVLARAWELLSGQPSKFVVLSSSSIQQTPQTTRTMRFLITIYENQRWWVGLDWTAALLPSERSTWCSATLESVPPPSAFALPPPTVTFVGDGKGGLFKRTASWTWDEGEWKVSVQKEAGFKRVEKELPVAKEDTTPSANRVGKAKRKVHETNQKMKSYRDSDSKDEDAYDPDDPDAAESSFSLQVDDSDEQVTDDDGWVYGDNKWRCFSSSGGLGKYTRFRKWTRIALLTEVVEPASAAEAYNHASEQREAYSAASREREAGDDALSRHSVDSSRRSIDQEDDRDSNSLRKRLKSVIRKTTGNTQS